MEIEDQTIKKILIWVAGISSVLALVSIQINLGLRTERDMLVKELQSKDLKNQRLKNAAKISDYYYRFDQPTRISVINDVSKWVDHYLPQYFPDGPFIREDFLAIAMVESAFEQYLTGKRKEYGIFQIMPESSDWAGVKKNQFDLRVNTELAMFVLQKKYEEYKDYKIAIIAYNGLVKKRGKISEEYWEKFIKYRRALDDILGNNVLFEK